MASNKFLINNLSAINDVQDSDLVLMERGNTSYKSQFYNFDHLKNLSVYNLNANNILVVGQGSVGNVNGPSSSTGNHVAVFDGTDGKHIKDSGYTIAKSVPANAVFTDTTYQADGSTISLNTSTNTFSVNQINHSKISDWTSATGAFVTTNTPQNISGKKIFSTISANANPSSSYSIKNTDNLIMNLNGGNNSYNVTYQTLYNDIYNKVKTQLEQEGWGTNMDINSGSSGIFYDPKITYEWLYAVSTIEVPFNFALTTLTDVNKMKINGFPWSDYAYSVGIGTDNVTGYKFFRAGTIIEQSKQNGKDLTLFPLQIYDDYVQQDPIYLTVEDIISKNFKGLDNVITNATSSLYVSGVTNNLFKCVIYKAATIKPGYAVKYQTTTFGPTTLTKEFDNTRKKTVNLLRSNGYINTSSVARYIYKNWRSLDTGPQWCYNRLDADYGINFYIYNFNETSLT